MRLLALPGRSSKLIAAGIPGEQIAAIGDADSDAKKQALFEKVRSGRIRVLIGSTAKMGTGTNVQKRLVALHHLDAPWKPAKSSNATAAFAAGQRERRSGDLSRYVTPDHSMPICGRHWKPKRVSSRVIPEQYAARRAEDIGSQELSYAEVKAIASGNPAVLTLAEADAELQRLSLLKKNHLDEQFVARRSVRDLPGTIAALSEKLSKLSADDATAKAHANDPITIGGRAGTRRTFRSHGGKLDALPKSVGCTTRIALGTYQGLRFGLVLHPQFPADVYLEGKITPPIHAVAGPQGPAARPGD